MQQIYLWSKDSNNLLLLSLHTFKNRLKINQLNKYIYDFLENDLQMFFWWNDSKNFLVSLILEYFCKKV